MGVFNCQGAGWCRVGKKNIIHDEQPGTATGVIRAKDVDYLPRVADDEWNGDAIVYSHLGGMYCLLRALAIIITHLNAVINLILVDILLDLHCR